MWPRFCTREIKSRISSEIKKSGMFPIQVDSTQDVSAKDQVSIVVMYVDSSNVVKERLFALIDAEEATGEYYLKLLKDALDDADIDISTVYQTCKVFTKVVLRYSRKCW